MLTGVSSLQNQRGSSKAGSGEAGSHAKAAALVYRWAEEGACRGAHVDPDPDCPPANQHPGEQGERTLQVIPALASPGISSQGHLTVLGYGCQYEQEMSLSMLAR